ncbi:MAG: hypothetical protein DWQ05_16920 [Calditrichaeota bacterium]|nr:MAG: hypothetical protein DWQ05_16920 [Calditrichota bacterium]
MTPLTLQRLWKTSVGLILFSLIFFYLGMPLFKDNAIDPMPTATNKPTLQTPKPQDVKNQPSYTYIGESQSTMVDENQKNGTGSKHPAPAAPLRVSENKTKKGQVPDLFIDLGSHSLSEIIAHHGFLPAIKSPTRVLGKIENNRFKPLTAQELKRFARRGRNGQAFPAARRWLQRIAAEFNIPENELQLILLVPHETEVRFLTAQNHAMQKSGIPNREIASMQGYYDKMFDLEITEIQTRDGRKHPVYNSSQ